MQQKLGTIPNLQDPYVRATSNVNYSPTQSPNIKILLKRDSSFMATEVIQGCYQKQKFCEFKIVWDLHEDRNEGRSYGTTYLKNVYKSLRISAILTGQNAGINS